LATGFPLEANWPLATGQARLENLPAMTHAQQFANFSQLLILRIFLQLFLRFTFEMRKQNIFLFYQRKKVVFKAK
jgi:hypothetical protein